MANPAINKVDQAVAKFTHELLGIARKQKVDFAYVGAKATKPDEINKVMQVNTKAVSDILSKGN